MQVFATNRYRFQRPGVTMLTPPTGEGGGQLVSKQPEFAELYFELEPGQFQDAPDWIKDDQMFKWAIESGDIKVVGKGVDTSLPSLPPEGKEAPTMHVGAQPHRAESQLDKKPSRRS